MRWLMTALMAVLVAGCSGVAPAGKQQPVRRVMYVSAVEFKGGALAAKEPFPAAPPPPGHGIQLKPVGADGRWETETYHFVPGTLVAYQGDEVELRIWGVNGAQHDTIVEGYDQKAVVKRGGMTVMTFVADKPGIFRILCIDHAPAMVSQLLVLPRK